MTTRRALLMVAAVTCLVLGGCTHAADWRADTSRSSVGTYDVSGIQMQPEIAALLPEEVLADGVLDVAASTDYAPAEFLDTQGSPIGYDVDLTKAIAAVLGVTSRTHTAEFDSIIAAVGSKYDVGISSFTITSARTLEVDMLAYINVGSRFNVAAGNPEGIDVSDHLNLCGYTVGVQVGTAQETTMNELAQSCRDADHPTLSVRAYSTQSEAATGLASNVIDAMYSDSTVADYAVELTDGALQTLGEVEDALPQGIVISKTDPQLAAALQAAVQHLMDEGVWEEILTSWGIEDAALDNAVLNPKVEG